MNKIALVQTTDRNINQLQQNVKQVVDPISINPMVNGVLISSIALNAGNNSIKHGLGRQPFGWIPVRMEGGFVELYDNGLTSALLILNASTAATISLYVF